MTDAITAISDVSTSTLLTSCGVVAPSAIRAASSRWRATSRPMNSVATLAQATSSTSSAPARVIVSSPRRPPTTDSPRTSTDTISLLVGLSSRRTRFASSRTWARVTPGFSRATIFE